MSKYRPPGLRPRSGEDVAQPEANAAGAQSAAAAARRTRFATAPAQQYGLASRGDLRLQDSPAAQHDFFDRISAAAAAGAPADTVLADLRKLREAMLHAGPSPFLTQVFLYSVRTAAPAGHYQTFVPCITYLLEPRAAKHLSRAQRRELGALLALQLAHGAHDNAAAFAVFFAHANEHAAPRAHAVLHAWARGDYVRWLELYNTETDAATRAVMGRGVDAILRRMARTLSAAYFQYPRADLERLLPRGTTAADFCATYAPHWEHGDPVVMRRRP